MSVGEVQGRRGKKTDTDNGNSKPTSDCNLLTKTLFMTVTEEQRKRRADRGGVKKRK